MAQYRKIPVVIEAWHWTPPELKETIPEWLIAAVERDEVHIRNDHPIMLKITTLEGVMSASPGDWIIKGVNGEIYPCKPEIFAKTYVPHSDDEAQLSRECGDNLNPPTLPYELLGAPVHLGLDLGPGPDQAEWQPNEKYTRFRDQLQEVINGNSMENGSDTPDFMLAEMLTDMLMSFDRLMQKRDGWYGGSHRQLKAQIEAEGSHTEAANAEIDRLRGA